jgi:hypothetical protein
MKFKRETFEKALKANKIVRYQQHFEAVVKSYLEIENQALRIHDVVGRSEQLKADLYRFRDMWCQNIDIATIDEYVDGLGF